ncbi:MAG: hypothetical protein AAB013_03680, partial [Planctomycetota bacterium]
MNIRYRTPRGLEGNTHWEYWLGTPNGMIKHVVPGGETFHYTILELLRELNNIRTQIDINNDGRDDLIFVDDINAFSDLSLPLAPGCSP